jgi:hypothetical protein
LVVGFRHGGDVRENQAAVIGRATCSCSIAAGGRFVWFPTYIRETLFDQYAFETRTRGAADLPTDPPPQTAADQIGEDTARLVARLSSEYVLRALKVLTEFHGADMVTAVLTQAIIAANTSHLDGRAGEGALYAGLEHTPPDAVRRPISVLALAQSMGLPFETTRRHVNKLVKAGRCVRVRGGVIVPASVLEHPRTREATMTNVANVRRFVRALKAAGVTAD